MAVPRHEASHDEPRPRRSPLTRSPMRFRTNVEDVGSFFSRSSKSISGNAIDDLLDSAEITQAIEKLQKRCIIKFTESHMHIICNHDASEGGVQVWS